jgi:predicted NUDIX family phosphoesterase
MEKILVIPTKAIVQESFCGIKKLQEPLLRQTISSQGSFMCRNLAEQDTNFKQIIPYLIYRFKDKFFLMQRSAKASETRLKSKYSLGIGGHVRKEDLTAAGSLLSLAEREFHEEINFSGNYKAKFLGLLNDDSNPVGKVHSGLIYLLEGDTDNISIKSELTSGFLMTFKELKTFYNSMETWSQIVMDYLETTQF